MLRGQTRSEVEATFLQACQEADLQDSGVISWPVSQIHACCCQYMSRCTAFVFEYFLSLISMQTVRAELLILQCLQHIWERHLCADLYRQTTQ